MILKKMAFVLALSFIILLAGPVFLDFAVDTDRESVVEAAYTWQAPVGMSDSYQAPRGASDVWMAP